MDEQPKLLDVPQNMPRPGFRERPIRGRPRIVTGIHHFSKRKSGPYAPWAAVDGKGPEGETCGSCAHLFRRGGCAKTYIKCGARPMTHGSATDIRVKDPACVAWKEKP